MNTIHHLSQYALQELKDSYSEHEIECICKIFLPIRKFTFLYDTAQLPEDAEEGAVLTLEQQGSQSRVIVREQYH